ncbi:HNH endonuclease [Staphylococcus delphini]|uniref:HNH endonuclease n=1 Tax=Staphylococcus delphini TaxID=53344 RepID=UPI000BBB9BB5|nr:HNH endonuclease signature motif containing protein [Staphylococcus delphini]PCF72839.1 HNH endonuclease [Staphylococcus delphini]UXS21184.1 HNH endonuclease [Staphylococcus delphini]
MSSFSDYIEKRNENRKFYMRARWRKVRQQVLERDHFECLHCKAEGKLTINQHQSLEVDHILELNDRPDLAYDIDNLQTLCKYHHNKKHGRFEHVKKKYDDERW